MQMGERRQYFFFSSVIQFIFLYTKHTNYLRKLNTSRCIRPQVYLFIISLIISSNSVRFVFLSNLCTTFENIVRIIVGPLRLTQKGRIEKIYFSPNGRASTNVFWWNSSVIHDTWVACVRIDYMSLLYLLITDFVCYNIRNLCSSDLTHDFMWSCENNNKKNKQTIVANYRNLKYMLLK